MIQPSALPAKSSIGTVAGAQPGAAQNGGIPSGFAAFLALGLPGGEEAAGATAADGDLAAALLRQVTGKEGGKNLPDALPDDLAGDTATEGEEIKDTSADALLEGNDDAGAGLDADTATDGETPSVPVASPHGPSQNAIDALTAALDKPQSASEKSQVTGNRAEVLTNVIAKLSGGETRDASDVTNGSTVVEPGKVARLVQVAVAPAASDEAGLRAQLQVQTKNDAAKSAQRTAQNPTIDAKLVASVPAPASSATPQSADGTVQVSVNLPKFPGAPLQSLAQTEKTGEVPALPVTANSREAQASRPGAAALRPVAETAQANAAAVPTEIASTENAEKPDAATARPLRAAQEAPSPAESKAGQSGLRAAAVALDVPQGDNAVPRAGDLQPLLAVREAQSQVQSPSTAPLNSPASLAQTTKLDFAAIVDRLVEAREAAAPQAVKATLAHSEFGQVSLRFDQNANGLTVSMKSSDPDFAPAVQAATASGQSSNANDNGSNAPRQDGQSQQSANLASGQPQQQSQGSARGNDRDRPEAASQAGSNSSQLKQDKTDPDGRDGIYA